MSTDARVCIAEGRDVELVVNRLGGKRAKKDKRELEGYWFGPPVSCDKHNHLYCVYHDECNCGQVTGLLDEPRKEKK